MHKIKSIIFSILFISAAFNLNAQDYDSCDEIYEITETQAKYHEEPRVLYKYLKDELIPIVTQCRKEHGTFISKLYLVFVINKNGQIKDIELPKLEASLVYKNSIIEKLKSMKAWTPATIKGKPVCSKYILPISCIKWN